MTNKNTKNIYILQVTSNLQITIKDNHFYPVGQHYLKDSVVIL